ncbi:MAG: tyrosine-protein phosphatase [Schleiferilactobacillus perolens]|uniref:tyrosine-protein phosphatase n=1 Tax=Schleiferilactobacillus perolens TaxID=100468 RepID=UPI0039E98E3E
MTQRLLPITSGWNFRELGGYPTKTGETTKYHKILRSGGLEKLNKTDQQYLIDYGLNIDMDFRSTEEREDYPDVVPEGVRYIFNPVLAEDETQNSKTAAQLKEQMRQDPQNGYAHMLQVYRDIVHQTHAQDAYKRFFDALLTNEKDDQTLLFHCAAGKDRTGMGAYFFLSALDVPEDVILEDYLLTNTVTKERLADMVKAVRADGGNETMVKNIQSLYSVSADYLAAARHAMDNMSGSTPNYLKEVLSLSDDDLADLKHIYTEKK